MKAGTFDIYPSHSADPYITRRSKSVTVNKEGKVFHPSPGPKSTPVKSIISVNVNRWDSISAIHILSDRIIVWGHCVWLFGSLVFQGSALCKLHHEYTICDGILMWILAIWGCTEFMLFKYQYIFMIFHIDILSFRKIQNSTKECCCPVECVSWKPHHDAWPALND